MKLLIVDQDRDFVEMLTGWLKTSGHEVYRAYTGASACFEWEQRQPDLVIIDPILKDVDGLAWFREIRARYDAPILVITANKGVENEVDYLNFGADDYLHKPFFPTQMRARMQAVSRRGRSTLAQRPSSLITVGPIGVDALHNQVVAHGKTASLTPTESKLLHFLALNANHVCTANQIVSQVWGFNNHGDAYLIKAHIRHLRQKIEPDPSHPAYILTIPGVGYTLTCPQESAEPGEII